jgi:hypothetical protein
VRKYCFTEVLPQIDEIIELAKHNADKNLVRTMKALVPEFVSKNSAYEKLDSSD